MCISAFGDVGESRLCKAGNRYASVVKEPPLSTSVRETARRPLRIFPFDPMFDRFHDPIISSVPYELVTPGPAGRLVEVVDFDMSTKQWLPPLDLNSPEVLITQGLSPSERDLRSHQQMVYAVSMRVLEAFERGLGRPFDWLQRLKLLPHALNQMTAYSLPDLFSRVFRVFHRRAHRCQSWRLSGTAHLHIAFLRRGRSRNLSPRHVGASPVRHRARRDGLP